MPGKIPGFPENFPVPGKIPGKKIPGFIPGKKFPEKFQDSDIYTINWSKNLKIFYRQKPTILIYLKNSRKIKKLI